MFTLSRLTLITLLFASSSFAETLQCDSPYKGKSPNQAEINKIIEDHGNWLQLGANPDKKGKANLCGSNLNKVDLSLQDLSHANFDGADLSEANLNHTILDNASLQKTYFRWAIMGYTSLEDANLEGAVLQDIVGHNIELHQANLTNADFSNADLSHASLRGATADNATFLSATLIGSNLAWSTFTNSDFTESNLSAADLNHANLQGSNFYDATLDDADLSNTNLIQAEFIMTSLTNANFTDADFNHAIYQPKLGSLPNVIGLASAKNFQNIRVKSFQATAPALAELRTSYKAIGMRSMERKVTAMLKHKEMLLNWERGGTGYIESAFSYLFFYLTSDFGAEPGRPLRIFLGLIFLFAIPYRISIWHASKQGGIVAIWQSGRFQQWDKTHEHFEAKELMMLIKPTPVSTWQARIKQSIRLTQTALFFSLMSSFQIGWRELNVSNWISRLQPREYSLKAKGWVRVVAGSQSLISAYLIVLWALVYFGRPFEW